MVMVVVAAAALMVVVMAMEYHIVSAQQTFRTFNYFQHLFGREFIPWSSDDASVSIVAAQ